MTSLLRIASFLLLAIVLLGAVSVQAQSIPLTLPEGSGTEGETITVPITVDADLDGRNVLSYELALNFRSTVLRVQDVTSSGTLSDAFGNVQYSVERAGQYNATLRIAAAGASALTGSGTLVNVVFDLTNRGTSGLSFDAERTVFNEGSPALDLSDGGRVDVAAQPVISVSPKTAEVLRGETRSFSVSGGTAPYTWSVTDTTVASIDTNGVLTALAPGQTRVTAVDDTGIQDTSDAIRVIGFQLTLPDTSARVGSTIDVPIRTTDLTGLGVTAGQFQIDGLTSDRVTLSGTKTTGTLLDGREILLSDRGSAHTVAFAGDAELSGAGVLLYLTLHLDEDTPGRTGLSLNDILFNETLPGFGDRAGITAEALPTLSVSPRSGTLLAGESVDLAVQNATGTLTWTVSRPALASISQTGRLTALQGGSVTATATDEIGATVTTDAFSIHDVTAGFSDVEARPNETVRVPLRMENLPAAASPTSIEMAVRYPSTLVSVTGVEGTGTQTEGWSYSISDNSGVVTIAGAGATPIETDGDVLMLVFETADLATDQTATLTVDRLVLNEGRPTAQVDTRSDILITQSNRAPSFASLPTTRFVIGNGYQASVSATDPDGDALSITAPTRPSWLTLTDNGDGTASLSGTPPSVGFYDLTLSVSDGELQDDRSFLLATYTSTTTATLSEGDPAPQSFSSIGLTVDLASLDVGSELFVGEQTDPQAGGMAVPSGRTLAVDRLWTLDFDADPVFAGTVCFDVTTLPSTLDPSTLAVHKRNGPTDAWSAPLTAELRPDASAPDQLCATDVRSFSDFVVTALPQLSVSPDGGALLAGESVDLSVQNATDPVSWSVSDAALATISSAGRLTALQGGSVTATATDANGATVTTQPFVIDDVTMAFADTSARPNETVRLPLRIGNLPAAVDPTAIEMDVRYPSTLLSVTGVEGTGTRTDGWTYSLSDDGSVATITGSGSTPVEADGDFLILIVETADVSERTDTLRIERLVLNQGQPTARTRNSPFTVTQANRAPGFATLPSTRLLADSSYESTVTGSDPDDDAVSITAPTRPSWLTLTDNGDGTASLSGTPPSVGFFDLTLSIGDGALQTERSLTLAAYTSTTTAPLPAGDPAPQSFSSIGLTVDLASLDVESDLFVGDQTGPEAGGLTVPSGRTLAIDRLWTLDFDADPVFAGTVCFDVTSLPSNLDPSTLAVHKRSGPTEAWSAPLTAEPRPDATDPAQVCATDVRSFSDFILTALPQLSVSPNGGTLLAGESVDLSVQGTTGPVSWSVSNTALATISSAGRLTALQGGSVTATATDSIGASATTSPFFIDDVTMAFADTSARPNETVRLPLRIGNLPAVAAPTAIEMDVRYPAALLSVTGVESAGTRTEGWAYSLTDNSGVVTIAGAGSTPVEANGNFLILVVETADVAERTDTLRIERLVLNEGQPTARTRNSPFTVTQANRAPGFSGLPSTRLVAGTSYAAAAAGSDPDGDAVSITAPTRPDWLTVTDNGNGTATLTGTPPSVGFFDLTLSISDGTLQTDRSLILAAYTSTTTATLPAGDPAPQSFSSIGLEVDLAALDAERTMFVGEQTGPQPDSLSLPDGQGLAVTRLWTLDFDGAPVFSATVCFDVTTLVNNVDPSEIAVRKRSSATEAWSAPLATELRPNATAPTQICATDIRSFSDFVVTADRDLLPVELVDFSAQRDDAAIVLTWMTASEKNNSGFHVERAVDGGPFGRLQFVQGGGTTSRVTRYRLVDRRIPFHTDRVVYRLRQVDLDGTVTIGPEVTVQASTPTTLELHKTFPNPAYGAVTVRYELPEPGSVRLAVYNLLGQRVQVVAGGAQPAGRVQHTLDVSRLATGTYFLRLETPKGARTQRLTVVR